METGYVTTPFGRRPMTLGMLASQMTACEIDPAKSVDKWKIYRALCEAKPLLGITDRALAVLNALLSFHPKNELSEENGLVVFPSNAQLSLRSHGMAEQTIRRHLAALVDAGLLIRKDSPNGKRYARRGREGEVSEAFGFSLAPLVSRSEEIEHLATAVVAERLHVQHLRERISLCRRDIAKLIETALAEQINGDWQGIHTGFRSLIDELPRFPTAAALENLLDELVILRDDIVNRLEMQLKTQKQSANPYQNERHIQNSNPESYSDLEPSFETKRGRQRWINTTLSPCRWLGISIQALAGSDRAMRKQRAANWERRWKTTAISNHSRSASFFKPARRSSITGRAVPSAVGVTCCRPRLSFEPCSMSAHPPIRMPA